MSERNCKQKPNGTGESLIKPQVRDYNSAHRGTPC